MLSLATIRKRVKDLAKLVNAPQELTRVAGSPDWMGGMYVEIDNKGYHYVNSERGKEYERHTTKDIQELLYWILKDITSEIASDYELSNRIPYADSRRLWFKKWVELMGIIDQEFQKRLEEELKQILKEAPYRDEKGYKDEG
jgi:hypothetical protein